MTRDYEAVIGLEVHVQVRTRTKMFCGCPNCFGAEPNTAVCPVCLGYPGVMPVPNEEAIRKTIVAGLMCDCRIAGRSKFDRKNYFYPDMPKNYQISQYDMPFCLGGGIPVGGTGFSGEPLATKNIGLTRMHLEEDVAKSIHYGRFSVIDFNRAGVPLLEIVSEPDMRSADEAYAYLTGLKQIMQYADISDCDMEKGQMRCDVNVSVRKHGATAFGEKIEIKNLNSFRAVHRSLVYEIERQIDALEEGLALRQETRRWDDDAGVTAVMRTKESAHDYRYFPEPDLMPVVISDAWRREIAENLPETPQHRRQRFIGQYNITEYDAQVLTQDKTLADYFETAAQAKVNAKTLANWIQTELLRVLGEQGLEVGQSPVPPANLGELIALIEDNTISSKIAKWVFEEMLSSGKPPRTIVEEKGMRQVTDAGEIEQFVDQAIAGNPAAVQEYRDGKEKALQYFVGQVMKLTRGKANPKMVIDLLKDKLAQ
jgi:aspartyl-tRNA(Asn)/glutamyl-tRNA(Gln) amidotransferase subunit B